MTSVRIDLDDGLSTGHHIEVSAHDFPGAPEPVWLQLGPAALPMSEAKALELAKALTNVVVERRTILANAEVSA